MMMMMMMMMMMITISLETITDHHQLMPLALQ